MVTCTGTTTHFATGCELLNHYDTDNDGIISPDEATIADNAHTDGVITLDERNFVMDAYNLGSINAVCPGCYTTPLDTETKTMALTEGNHTIQISLSGYDILQATINVSPTEVTCTAGPCGTTGPPGVMASGWTVTTYLKTTAVVSDVCSWITGLGGFRNLQWTSHVLEAYYVYIGAAGHSVGFSPVTWNDVLGLYYYYINDLSAGNGKTGCGFT